MIDPPGVGPAGTVEFEVVRSTDDGLAAVFARQFERGFDLDLGPVWRALLVQRPGQDHVLLVTAHHIASDGWSTVVLSRDIRELCTAFARGRVPDLPDPAVCAGDPLA